MKRDLSSWASIALIVSGVAVVVTLVFLILEIKESTGVARVSVYGDLLERINQLELMQAQDPDLIRVRDAYFRGENPEETDDQILRFRAGLSILFRSYE